MEISTQRARVVAVLGPTNTGKTHLAIERMMGHPTGIIGFPLRLLARENYEKVARLKGTAQTALITGEEKIVPPHARYFLCTVESMPTDRMVDFLAVDEIQLCADRDRGHVFTERLLHARGRFETMFMGAETIRPLLSALVPEAVIETRPRFSTLAYTGPRKVTRLPARTAVVAFSAADVYALAELVRRQRGGAAVVLGALSPRTRNAQVAMFQNGEVDYLIATDAIGMGLNMDIDHVAFAATRKFDGHVPRRLTPPELAQIAGRAGRHMNDGTFGVTADAEGFDAETAERLERHVFEPLQFLYWRNPRLRFTSIDVLQRSLAKPPETPGLARSLEGDDQRALAALARDSDIRDMARHPAAIQQLWEVCRIPDFRKMLSDSHFQLLGTLYRHLRTEGRLPEDWVAEQVRRIDRDDGDIEALTARLAAIRTWTYVSHRSGWLADAGHWQGRTMDIEDRLSDALHARLTQRFVDQRTAVLMRRLKDRAELEAGIDAEGAVTVEGHFVGRLEGFSFVPDSEASGEAARAVAGAAAKALRSRIGARVHALEVEGNAAFDLDAGGRVLWHGAAVARLVAGASALRPRLEILGGDLLEAAGRDRVQARLGAWLDGLLDHRLGPLLAAPDAEMPGPARGLMFQLAEGLGKVRRTDALAQIEALDKDTRRALRQRGVRIGRQSVWMPALIKPAAAWLAGLLWAVFHEVRPVPAPLPAGRVSVPVEPGTPHGYYEASGFRVAGPLALRVDILERVAELAFEASRKGPFAPPAEMMSVAGCNAAGLTPVLEALGYRRRDEAGADADAPPLFGRAAHHPARPARPTRAKADPPKRRRRHGPRSEDESPFAKLRELDLKR